jgi:anti-anti-sigma factor
MTSPGVQLRWVDEQAVVTVPDEIDVVNADAVRHALLTETSHDVPVVIIDMSATTFCDSAGVQAIVDTYKQAAANHIQLRLVAIAILRILTLAGIDQVIPIYPTLEAALAQATAAPGEQQRPGDDRN